MPFQQATWPSRRMYLPVQLVARLLAAPPRRRRQRGAFRIARARWRARQQSGTSAGSTPVWIAGSFTFGLATGALLMFLFDPQHGTRRRHMARDRGGAWLRRSFRSLRRSLRGVRAGAYGLSQRAIHALPRRRADFDDVALVHRVESEVFRDRRVPKGQINLNAELGVIELRGQLDRPEQIAALEAAVRRVAGVRGVHNYLHLPGTPAPNKRRALEAG